MSAILHIVNQSPFANNVLKQCISRLNIDRGDSLILLEDGVYSATSQHPFAQAISNVKRCYAMESDILARGITSDSLLANIQLIDYDEFVTLTIEFPLSHSWY